MDRVARDKFRWRCSRGLLELDMVRGMFLEQHANTMSEEELAALVELLDYPDSDLWGVASGRSERYRGRPPIGKW